MQITVERYAIVYVVAENPLYDLSSCKKKEAVKYMKTCSKCTCPALQKQASNIFNIQELVRNAYSQAPHNRPDNTKLFVVPFVYIFMFLLGGFGAEPFINHSMETSKIRYICIRYLN